MDATSTPNDNTSVAESAPHNVQVNSTPGSEGVKRKRQPRNSACQGCSQLKMKCISQPSGVCERCDRMGRACLPALPKLSKRQRESGVMESDISAIGYFAATPGPPPRFDPPGLKEPDDNALLSRHDLSHADSRSFVSFFSRGLGNSTVCADLLNGIDYNFVAGAFSRFRQFTPHFPFVDIPSGADVSAMLGRRPMLTLAVCTVTSASWLDIQHRLSQAFLYALATKSILGDERSLDLFTGLLVYLGWQHHYLSRQKLHQKLCLVAGMAADLGLYRFDHNAPVGLLLEQDRAFVGAYYLCTGLCANLPHKPNPLQWTNNLRRSAEHVARTGSLPTDRTISGVLELAHAVDDLEVALRDHSSQPGAIHFVDMTITAALQRVEVLKPVPLSRNYSLSLSAATIRMYYKRIRHGDSANASILIKCACAVKEYLDEVLARPAATLHQMAVVDWADLLEILLVMAQIPRSTSAAGWEAGAVVSMLQPDEVLDAVPRHMASAPADDPSTSRSDALRDRLYEACRIIKSHMASHRDTNTRFERVELFDAGVLDPDFWAMLAKSEAQISSQAQT